MASRSTSRCAAASATLTIDTVNPTNPDSDQRTALAYIAMMLMVWFILGFALYAVAYAVVGSMVSRQEDVNAAATPITIVVIARYLLAQVTVQDPSGTVATVMSWIPPVLGDADAAGERGPGRGGSPDLRTFHPAHRQAGELE